MKPQSLPLLVEIHTPAAERLAVLRHLREKWTIDLRGAIGVNPEVAAATAEAIDLLNALIGELENQQPTTADPQFTPHAQGVRNDQDSPFSRANPD